MLLLARDVATNANSRVYITFVLLEGDVELFNPSLAAASPPHAPCTLPALARTPATAALESRLPPAALPYSVVHSLEAPL